MNKTAISTIRRIHLFAFYNGQELDGRLLSSLVLSPEQFHGFSYAQHPLNFKSNQMPMDLVKQRDVQQIAFSGKMSKLFAERILKDYWQNPTKQGLAKINIDIIQLNEYLAHSSK